MGIIFGKKKPVSRITFQDKAILKLKQQRDTLKLYQKKIEKNLESDRQLAKQLIVDGKKDRAKLLLRKKRYQEQLLTKTDNQLENLEKLANDIEFAQVEVDVTQGLKEGNEALKKVNESLNIEDIERILDETREGVSKQQEIDALLSGALTEEDEDEALKEFNLLLASTLPDVPSEKLSEASQETILPEVPSTPIEDQKKKERTPVLLEA